MIHCMHPDRTNEPASYRKPTDAFEKVVRGAVRKWDHELALLPQPAAGHVHTPVSLTHIHVRDCGACPRQVMSLVQRYGVFLAIPLCKNMREHVVGCRK